MARTAGARARARRITTWVTVALLAVLGTEFGLAATESPTLRVPGPSGLLREAFGAAAAAGTFHYRAVWRAGGVSQVVVGDAGPSSGVQSVTIGSEGFTVIVTAGMAYVEGDAAALRDQLGLPTATATAAAGRWVALGPADGPYPSIEQEGVTTSGALAQVLMAPAATSSVRGSHGVLVARIIGRIPHGGVSTGSARLDVAARSGLPASYAAHGSNGGQPWSSTIAFSRWGEHVAESAPAGAVPFASLLRPGSATRVR
jgi:hypothetical protein